MNRAAEAAVPEAKALLVNAVKEMSVQDAKGFVTCGDTSATEYFRRRTSQPLAAKFLPIVQRATAKVQLAQKYDQFAGEAARFGLTDQQHSNIEQVGQSSKLPAKVFGAIGK